MLELDAIKQIHSDTIERGGIVRVSRELVLESPEQFARVFAALRITVLEVKHHWNTSIDYIICSPFLPRTSLALETPEYTIDMSIERADEPDGGDLYAQFRGIDESRVLVPKGSEDD